LQVFLAESKYSVGLSIVLLSFETLRHTLVRRLCLLCAPFLGVHPAALVAVAALALLARAFLFVYSTQVGGVTR